MCEWRVGALLRGGDVLSPNRSVLRRWGNSMTARTFGAWRKYAHEVAREKVSTAELTMRRWLQWRVSRALQRWLDGVTFLSEQQRLAKKATKSWKAGGVSHGWRRWRDATEPRHRRAARRAFQRRLPIGRAWQRWNDAIRSRHSHGLAALKLAASAWCERKDMLMKWQARSSPPHPPRPLLPSSTPLTRTPPLARRPSTSSALRRRRAPTRRRLCAASSARSASVGCAKRTRRGTVT